MRKFFSKKSKLFCFTPEVMLLTFIIETVFAVYVFIKHRMSLFGKIAGLILVSLAVFQIAEYQVCANYYPFLWARIGFAATAILPVLSLHLVLLIINPTLKLRMKSRAARLLKLSYTVALGFIFYTIFSPNAIISAVCGGNYVIFQTRMNLYWLYTAYYAFFLFLALWICYKEISATDDRNKKTLLYWTIAGYLSFMVPTALIYLVYRITFTAVASIMCGFALFLAFIITFKIIPGYRRKMTAERVKK